MTVTVVTGKALCFIFLSFSFLFLTIFDSPIILTSTAWIFMRFSLFGSAMAVDERSEPRFSNFQGCCHGNQFSFSAILFLSRNSKTMRDSHMVPGEENIGNFVSHPVASSIMTSGDPETSYRFQRRYD